MFCAFIQADDFLLLYVQAESAIIALNCSGMVLGTQAIRYAPELLLQILYLFTVESLITIV